METLEITQKQITTADIVASNVRAEAARQGFSQVGFGKAIGLSQTQITQRWRGVRPWQLDELDAVANVLGITVADLVAVPSHMQAAPSSDEAANGSRGWTRTNNRPINGGRVTFVLAA